MKLDYVIADNAPIPHIKIVDENGEAVAVIERLGPRAEADALLFKAAPIGLELARKVDAARRKDWEGVDLDELNDLAGEFLAKAEGR